MNTILPPCLGDSSADIESEHFFFARYVASGSNADASTLIVNGAPAAEIRKL